MNIRQGPEPRRDDLDPLKEPERWEALVGQIGKKAAPYLAGRREPPGVLDLITRWARPALATAASLALLATAAVVARGEPQSPAGAAGTELALAEAVMPATFAAWVAGASSPSVTEMVRELETMQEVDR